MKKSLELLVFLPLISNQFALPSEQYLLQNKNPAVYSQAPKGDLITSVLGHIKAQAQKDPKYAANLYVHLINNNPKAKDKIIDEALSTYEKLSEKSQPETIVEPTLQICDYVIAKHKDSIHMARANLISGVLKFDNYRDIADGIRRLNEAAKQGKGDIKIRALYIMGLMKWHSLDPKDMKEAEKYFKEIIRIAPKGNAYSESAEEKLNNWQLKTE